MSTRYFQNVISEARRRFPQINYLSAAAKFENGGDVLFDVHLTMVKPEQKENVMYPDCFEMVHIANSKHSLTATIVELVRRCRFENDLEQELLIEHADLPLPMIIDEVEPLVSDEIARALDMVNEGGPAGDSAFPAAPGTPFLDGDDT